MTKVYLFDWGDTLMVDFPSANGKMCDWEVVEAVAGAKDTLQVLAKHHRIYIATGAADSTELEIKKAFERVGLSQFISGYFCKANLGVSKGSPLFFETIIQQLNVSPEDVVMVGDTLEKDIIPALAVGLTPILFSPKSADSTAVKAASSVPVPDHVKVISKLNALYQ